MKRRNFLKTAAGLAAGSLMLPGGLSAAEMAKNRHNILFLFTDDQRFDTIRALGNEHIITPNMDSLVHNGTTFTNAYIMGSQSAAVCMPSRAMLMTGRTLFHLNNPGFGNSIPPEHVTMPETFRSAGYKTFHTGKWHQDKKSFNRSFTTAGKIMFGGMSDHYDVPTYDYDPTGEYPKEKQYRSTEKHSSEMYADSAIKFLKNYKDNNPFYMYVSFQAPHDPRNMPKKYLDMYDPEKIPLPKNFLPEHPFDNGELKVRDEKLEKWPRTPEAIRRHIAAYYAMITHVDAQIGRILKALEETGKAGNTIIIFAGDNGLAVGRHGLMGKQNLYDHSVHVPLIIGCPGIPRNVKSDAFCYLSDIFPTLCDLIGVSVPGTVDSKGLASIIRGEDKGIRDSLFFVYKNFQRSVRTYRWKLIHYNVNGMKTTQLFDLQNDPWETANLADDPAQVDRINKLNALMKEWFENTGDKVELSKPDWGITVIPSWKARKQ